MYFLRGTFYADSYWNLLQNHVKPIHLEPNLQKAKRIKLWAGSIRKNSFGCSFCTVILSVKSCKNTDFLYLTVLASKPDCMQIKHKRASCILCHAFHGPASCGKVRKWEPSVRTSRQVTGHVFLGLRSQYLQVLCSLELIDEPFHSAFEAWMTLEFF